MDRFDELRDRIVPMLRPYFSRIAVFGSAARGEAANDSDLDLLVKLRPVESRPPLGLFRWVALEDELRARIGRPVDMVSEEGLSRHVRPYAERDKVILYEDQ